MYKLWYNKIRDPKSDKNITIYMDMLFTLISGLHQWFFGSIMFMILGIVEWHKIKILLFDIRYLLLVHIPILLFLILTGFG